LSALYGNKFILINGNGEFVQINNWLYIFGYSYIAFTNKNLKDWEKMDNDEWHETLRENEQIRIEGIVSTYEDGSVIPVEFVFNKKVPFMADSIEYDMYKCFEHKNSIWNTILNNHIQQNQESPKLLFVSHDPPYNTIADIMTNKMHIGSESLANTISKMSPYILATFHGHIHETVAVSKNYTQMLGKTNIFCSGNRWNYNECAIVIVDVDKKSCINSKRILV